jgi:hypothetical protein
MLKSPKSIGSTISIALFAALIVELIWGPPIVASKLTLVSAGLTTNQVVRILGQPTVDTRKSANNGPGAFIWWYEIPFHRKSIYVFFNDSHVVIRCEISDVGL